jgi:NADPH:quinone reductase-like Zn-dependent oxidoreductase
MKAVFFEKHGEPDVRRYRDAPDPAAGPGQVMAHVRG